MTKLIKMYGERNTNTNYMSKLIKRNLKVTELRGTVPSKIMKAQKLLPGKELVRDMYFHFSFKNNLGWKHACVKPMDELSKYKLVNSDLVFLTITKNPYSWLLSLYRRPYHQHFNDNPSFETFLQRQWKTIGRDNLKTHLANPVELWNIKNRSYLHLDSERTINAKTEDIFAAPEKVIKEISKRFEIERKRKKFVNFIKSTKDKTKDNSYYRDYYLSEKWREDLSDEAIAIINETIDKKLLSHFEYDLLS